MLRSSKQLSGFTVGATDGEIGHVDDFYFDDEKWTVRYIVVSTGRWLGRRVLISPISFSNTNWTAKAIELSLTKDQIRNSPDADLNAPVPRQYELTYYGYYGYPPYWGGPGYWGLAGYPGALASPAAAGTAPAETEAATGGARDSHLRSSRTVIGHHIQAVDGEIGHLDDLIVDDESWAIRYLRVDTSNWIGGKAVLVPQRVLREVNWLESKINVALTRDQVRNSPDYDADLLNPDDVQRLDTYYGSESR